MFAGREILLRFEYLTDDAIHDRGVCFDDLSIESIGWSDDAESDSDWAAEGFARVSGRIPQEYLVQIIRSSNGAPATVDRMVVSADGTGEFRIDALAVSEDVTVAVSAITPGLEGAANYSLDILP